MSASITIPTALRRYTAEQSTIQVTGGTVDDALRDLVTQHEALKQHLYTPDGALRSFVNVFLNDEDVRYLEREATAVADGDELAIIPSIAGGASAESPR